VLEHQRPQEGCPHGANTAYHIAVGLKNTVIGPNDRISQNAQHGLIVRITRRGLIALAGRFRSGGEGIQGWTSLFQAIFENGDSQLAGNLAPDMAAQSVSHAQKSPLVKQLQPRGIFSENPVVVFVVFFMSPDISLGCNIHPHGADRLSKSPLWRKFPDNIY